MLQLDMKDLPDVQPSYRAQIVQSLANFRREWQAHIEDTNLLDVDASVGLILADIADRLELNPQERYVMLGSQLVKGVNEYMNNSVQGKTLP